MVGRRLLTIEYIDHHDQERGGNTYASLFMYQQRDDDVVMSRPEEGSKMPIDKTHGVISKDIGQLNLIAVTLFNCSKRLL